MSDDGRLAVVVIAMVGNPFSPSYARARTQKDDRALSPLNYCSMNVAVYSRRRSPLRDWAFEEMPIASHHRAASELCVGASVFGWAGDRLVIDLDERSTPGPVGYPLRFPIRGQIIVRPEVLPQVDLTLDAEGRHRWWPVAPLARIEVRLEQPQLRFVGSGYHDANAGDVPLEETFDTWTWSRSRLRRGACLTYDVRTLTGATRRHAFCVDRNGSIERLTGLAECRLEPSRWRLARSAHVDAGEPVRVVRTLEDGPFYARALLRGSWRGESSLAVHETLAVQRLKRRWVKFCTSCRMRQTRHPRVRRNGSQIVAGAPSRG